MSSKLSLIYLQLAFVSALMFGMVSTARASLIGDEVTGQVVGFQDFSSNTATVTEGNSPTDSFQEFNTDPPVNSIRLAADFFDSDGTRLEISWVRLGPFGEDIGVVTWTFGSLDWVGGPPGIVTNLLDLGGNFTVNSFMVVDDHTIEIVTAAVPGDNPSAFLNHNFRIVPVHIPEPSSLALLGLGLGGLGLGATVRRRRR